MLKLLYAIYYYLIAFPLFFISTILCSVVTFTGCLLGGRAYFSYYPGKIWSIVSLGLFLCPVRIRGRENIPQADLPTVVMANHQSQLDIFIMYGFLGIPFRWVMKQSLKRMPFVGPACTAAGFIFVDETKPGSIKKTLEQGQEVLRSGNSIFIFPEGHRTKTGKVMRFKKGGFVMAYELDVPIIPVTIEGAYEALPVGSRIPKPRRLNLIIHPPVTINRDVPFPQAISEAVREVFHSITEPLGQTPVTATPEESPSPISEKP